jgi:hypothetical protein
LPELKGDFLSKSVFAKAKDLTGGVTTRNQATELAKKEAGDYSA